MFDTEEQLRRLSIKHREEETAHGADPTTERELLQQAAGIIAGMSEVEAYQIIKAFATFFELTT